jgi:hypothetical protein
MEMSKYTREQSVFLYDSYKKKKSQDSCNRRFRFKFSEICIPASSTTLKLLKKYFRLGLPCTRSTLGRMLF